MILAYENHGETTQVQLLQENGESVDHSEVFIDEPGIKNRPDLLVEITNLLEKNSIKPKTLTGILFVNGPGRFTPMRTATSIANLFARDLKIPLYPIDASDYQQHSSSFTKVIANGLPPAMSYVEAVFNNPPRITYSQKNERIEK
jgi:tRNA A37 threonylcarbamoyladenosine modification protein TsaB